MRESLTHRCQVRVYVWHDPEFPPGVMTYQGWQCYCHDDGCPYRFTTFKLSQEQTHEAAAEHTHRMNRAQQVVV